MSFLTDIQKEKLNEFVKFVKKELVIKNTPLIQILKDGSSLKTTAHYNYNGDKKEIKVRGKDRALVDIMRSIAHEMVHHKQYEDGRLSTQPPDIGYEIEDEANAKAGQYIKMFALKDKTIYDE